MTEFQRKLKEIQGLVSHRLSRGDNLPGLENDLKGLSDAINTVLKSHSPEVKCDVQPKQAGHIGISRPQQANTLSQEAPRHLRQAGCMTLHQ